MLILGLPAEACNFIGKQVAKKNATYAKPFLWLGKNINEFNKECLWKNRQQWVHYVSIVGTVASIASPYFSCGAAVFFGGSAFVAGAITFTAFRLGCEIFNKKGENPKIQNLIFGAVATAVVAHFTLVPMTSAFVFAAGGYLIEKTISAVSSTDLIKDLGQKLHQHPRLYHLVTISKSIFIAASAGTYSGFVFTKIFASENLTSILTNSIFKSLLVSLKIEIRKLIRQIQQNPPQTQAEQDAIAYVKSLYDVTWYLYWAVLGVWLFTDDIDLHFCLYLWFVVAPEVSDQLL